MIKVTKLTTNDRFEALEQVWNDLAEKADYCTIFQTFEWLYSWWQAFGDEHQLNILTVSRDGELVGIAPLMLTPRKKFGIRSRVVEFIGTPESDYNDFIGADKELITNAVVDYLLENRNDWTLIDLDQVSERTSTSKCLRSRLESIGQPVWIRQSEECLAFVYDGPEDKRSEYAPRKGKKLRNCINYFTKIDELELCELRSAEGIEDELYNLFRQHVARWMDTLTPSRFTEARHQDFFFKLNRQLSPKDRMSLLVLKFKGRAIAYEFNFDYKGTVCLYTCSHDVFYSKKSAGTIMNNMLHGHYVRKGVVELDFTRGAESYKGTMTNRVYVNYRYQIFGRRLGLAASRAYERIKASDPVQAVLKTPTAVKIKYKLKTTWHRNGTAHTIRTLLTRIRQSIIDLGTVILMVHDGEAAKPQKPGIELEFKKIDAGWSDELAGFMGEVMDSEKHRTILAKFESGNDCFACFHRGNIVSSSWGMYGEDLDPTDGFTLRAQGRQVLFSDSFTSPAYRRLGIGVYRRGTEIEYYRGRDLVCICAINKDNRASLSVATKCGFRTVGRRHVLRLFGRIVYKPGVVQIAESERTDGQVDIVRFVRKILARAKSMIYLTKTINIYDLAGTGTEETKPAIDAEYVELSRADIDEIASFLGTEKDSGKYMSLLRNFDNDAVVYGARYNGTMISIGWGVRHEDVDPSDGFSMVPSKNQIIISDLYTNPDFRGKGVLPFILSRQLDRFCREGYHCLIAIDSDNYSSIRVAEKLGFELARTVKCSRLFGICLSDPGGTRIEYRKA